MVSKKELIIFAALLTGVGMTIVVTIGIFLFKNVGSKKGSENELSRTAIVGSNKAHTSTDKTTNNKTENVEPVETPKTTQPTSPDSSTPIVEVGEIEYPFEVKSSVFRQVVISVNFYTDDEDPVPITDVFKFWFIHPSGREIHVLLLPNDSEFNKIFSGGESVGYIGGSYAQFKFHPNDVDLQPYPGLWRLRVVAPVGINAVFGMIEI